MTNQPEKLGKISIRLGVGELEKSQVYLLGGFRIACGSKEINLEEIRLHRARELLKLLALAPDHRLHRDQALEALWPEQDPQKSSHSLNQLLYLLRPILSSLDPAFTIHLENQYLALTAQSSLWTDVEAFEQASRNARLRLDPAECQAALMLYRGDLLPDDPYSDLFSRRREELKELRLLLLRQLATYHTSQAEYPQAIDLLQQLVGADPTNEEAQGMLIRAYALSGQHPLALKQCQKLVEMLKIELDSEPSEETQHLFKELQSGRLAQLSPSIKPSTSFRHHNLLSPLSSFIGRESQIAEVSRLVREKRLVTLTGAGGVGKSRLALQAVRPLFEHFSDGVFLVELAPLTNPDLVPRACTQAFGITLPVNENVELQLEYYLKPKRLLILLDNCEHLLGACSVLADRLLKACPELHILATSRESLGLSGEWTYRVPSLELPGAEMDHQTQATCEAVRLFVVRANEKSAQFRLTAQNSATVAQICRRLDGIPLAIELAASWVRMLTPDQIYTRLDDACNLLTGGSRVSLPRHQTLRATIDWSYDLLLPKERLLLQRLSVFAGGWSLEAAEAVGSDLSPEVACESITSGEVIGLLARIEDKSLVNAEYRWYGSRYGMLEMIRQYAGKKLQNRGEESTARQRHLAFYAGVTGRTPDYTNPDWQVEWLDRLEEELDNLRLALDWSVDHDVVTGLQILADLEEFWQLRGLYNEGILWLERLLAAEAAQRGAILPGGRRALQRARGLRVLCMLTFSRPAYPHPLFPKLLGEGINLLQKLDQGKDEEIVKFFLAYELLFSGFPGAPDFYQELQAIYEKSPGLPIETEYDLILAERNFSLAQFDFVKVYADRGLSACCNRNDLNKSTYFLYYLAYLEESNGHYDQALRLITERLAIHKKLRDSLGQADTLDQLVRLDMARGDYPEALVSLDQQEQILMRIPTPRAMPTFYVAGIATFWCAGDYDNAWRCAHDSLTNYPIDKLYYRMICNYLCWVALAQDDLGRAQALLEQTIGEDHDYVPHNRSILNTWAWFYARQERWTLAARLQGAQEDAWQRIHLRLALRERQVHDHCVSQVRAALGKEAYAAAFTAGQALTIHEALHEAYAALEGPACLPPFPWMDEQEPSFKPHIIG